MYYAIIIAAIIACVAFLMWYRKKQAASGPAAKSPQKGIIR